MLNNNKLTGSISPGIGAFSNLTQLCLAENKFNGIFPTEIGKAN
jgi:Leucine-rich repeat (LRR) protein